LTIQPPKTATEIKMVKTVTFERLPLNLNKLKEDWLDDEEG
jgi:hypothetical protein